MIILFPSRHRDHYHQNLAHQKNAKVQQRKANTQQAQQSLFNDILTIMTDILKEEASSSLVRVILENLVKEGKVWMCGYWFSIDYDLQNYQIMIFLLSCVFTGCDSCC